MESHLPRSINHGTFDRSHAAGDHPAAHQHHTPLRLHQLNLQAQSFKANSGLAGNMIHIEPKLNSSVKHNSAAQQIFLNHDVPPHNSDSSHHNHHRSEQISHSEKVNRRHQARSLTLQPVEKVVGRGAGGNSDKSPHLQLKHQNRSVSYMHQGANSGGADTHGRFQSIKLLLEGQQQSQSSVPDEFARSRLAPTFTHQHSLPVSNTVGLRGISQLANDNALNTHQNQRRGNNNRDPLSLFNSGSQAKEIDKILDQSRLGQYRQPVVSKHPMMDDYLWAQEQEIQIPQINNYDKSQAAKRLAGQNQQFSYEINQQNFSNLGAHVMTPPPQRHVQLTSSLEKFQQLQQQLVTDTSDQRINFSGNQSEDNKSTGVISNHQTINSVEGAGNANGNFRFAQGGVVPMNTSAAARSELNSNSAAAPGFVRSQQHTAPGPGNYFDALSADEMKLIQNNNEYAHMKPIAVMGPQGIHFNQPQNPMNFAPRTAEINNRTQGGMDGQAAGAASYMTDPINYEQFTPFDKGMNPINTPQSQFRVENRRARPVIIKNSVGDQGNKYFSQQANSIQSSQKRHRRQVLSQGRPQIGSMPLVGSIQVNDQDDNQMLQLPEKDNDRCKDQYNFTFFKERAEENSKEPESHETAPTQQMFTISRPKPGMNFLDQQSDQNILRRSNRADPKPVAAQSPQKVKLNSQLQQRQQQSTAATTSHSRRTIDDAGESVQKRIARVQQSAAKDGDDYSQVVNVVQQQQQRRLALHKVNLSAPTKTAQDTSNKS